MTPMDDWDATAKAVAAQRGTVSPPQGGMVSRPQGGTISPPRWELRLGLVLLGLLTTVLFGLLFLRGGSLIATVEVAELPSSAAEVSEIVDRASEDTDLLVFVAQPGQPGVLATQPRPPPTTEAGDILRKVQDAASPPAVLVISEQSPTEVGRALPRTVRVVDGDNVIREGSSQGAPGLLRLTIWTLALLAIGALLGRALFPPPQPVVKRIGGGTRTPPPSVGQDSGDVHVSTPHPAGGDLDFSPFQKHSVEVGAWIPQCPFCGAFRPRAERMDTGGSRYRCGQCAEEWQVPAGETWPTVVIRPRHRRAD